MLFQDRSDAGRKLANALGKYKDRHPVILALPRGGVLVAAEIAKSLDAPLDLVLVRKIGVPNQPELAMGAVVDDAEPIVVQNEDVIELADVTEQEFDEVCREELAEIDRQRAHYLAGRDRTEVKGQVTIIIDDGIATGATMWAAVMALRKQGPEELILAVPVASLESVERLHSGVDAVVCLETLIEFGAIGYYYRDFRQIGDDEVIATLKRFPANRVKQLP
jgi:predicted phosphoribosyltransferase